jgi:hypothetical protein
MTLLTETITDNRDASDVNLDPPMVAAFVATSLGSVAWKCNVSNSENYAAGFNNGYSHSGPMLWVANLETNTLIYNINLGTQVFDSVLLPDVTTIDSHVAIIDDIGSVWSVDGDGSGRVVEVLQADPTNPQYRFTLVSGDGGDNFWFRIARAFTMPDDTIRVLFIKQSDSGAVHGWHLWDNDAETYSHDVVTWSPKCTFQDDNGDIWICGVDNDLANTNSSSITTAYFQRLTNLGGTSPYTSPITFTGLPDLVGGTDPIDQTSIWGGIANGYFVGGWLDTIVSMEGDGSPMLGTCNNLLKLNLSDNTDKIITDISATATPGLTWAIPSTNIPADQDFIALTYSDITERKFGMFSTTDHSLVQTYDLEDWNAGAESLFPGDHLDDDIAYVGEYLYTREAFIAESSGYDNTFDTDNTQQYGKLWIYYLAEAPTDTSDENGDITIRCWAFSLDDHDFYVLRLGPSETLIYDLKTGQWSSWESPNRTNWRLHVGQNWVGFTDLEANNTDIIAGDDVEGVLWILDAEYGLDDRPDDSGLNDPFTRIVTGGVQVVGRNNIPCGAVTLDVALGAPVDTGTRILLEISDDLGHNWTDCGTVTVPAADYSKTIEWRALGLIKAPGRIFRLTDTGATVRISGANMR